MARIVRERPEATGIRIQAHPPRGGTSYDGYAETVRGMGEVIEHVHAQTSAVAAGAAR
jgi:hypothetical protein